MLETVGLPLGLVKGIAGQTRLRVIIHIYFNEMILYCSKYILVYFIFQTPDFILEKSLIYCVRVLVILLQKDDDL